MRAGDAGLAGLGRARARVGALDGWFGCPGYLHALGHQALTTRSAVVTSGAGVRLRGLDARHVVQSGARAFTAYAVTGESLPLRTVGSARSAHRSRSSQTSGAASSGDAVMASSVAGA